MKRKKKNAKNEAESNKKKEKIDLIDFIVGVCFVIAYFIYDKFDPSGSNFYIFFWIACGIIFVEVKVLKPLKIRQNVKKINTWLETDGSQLGIVTEKTMLEKVPLRFSVLCVLPEEVTLESLIGTFLLNCDDLVTRQIEEKAHEMAEEAGMVETNEVLKNVTDSFGTYTRTKEMPDLFEEAIKSLEANSIVDRPTTDKKWLHCVGSTGGTQFEAPQEIEIDI